MNAMRLITLITFIAILFLPGICLASGGYTGVNWDGKYLPVGFTLGTESWGVEASLVWHRSPFWYGFYAEALDRYGEEARIAGAGLEAGVAFFGFDAAALRRFAEGRTEAAWGWSARFLVSFVFVTAFARYASFVDDESYYEFGALIKFPVPLVD